jgi:pimeloyl-ACP methyl ester carboxylesterase
MPYANNNGVKIHYEIRGQGTPILVQHGFGGDLESFAETGFLRELQKNYRLIMVDARGHGQSDKPHQPEACTASIVANDYVSILDDLKIPKSIYLGYSMGGAIGFQCLALYALPRFSAMILGGASPYGDVLDADKKEHEERMAALRGAVEKGMEYYLTSYYEKRLTLPLTPAARAARLANDPQALLAMAGGILKWPGAAGILATITIPLLIFGGELDPRFPNIRECVKHLPTATFIPLPGKAHIGAMEDTETLLPQIRKFLAGVNID